MSQFRLARISLLLAAIGLNAAPALMTSAHAQAAAPAAEAAKDVVRPDMVKLIETKVITDLLTAKKYDEVQTRLTQAEAMPNVTPFESFVLNRIKVTLGSATKNDAMTKAGVEGLLASGRIAKKEEGDFTLYLANSAFTAKDYPKAIELLKKYQSISDTPEKARNMLTRAQLLSNDNAGAKESLIQAIAASEKAGKAPEEDDLRLLVAAAGRMKDWPTYTSALEKLVVIAPSDEFWADLLRRVQTKPGYDVRHQLDFYRLQSTVVKKMEPEDIAEWAELALIAGFPTEAKKAVDAGFASGAMGTGSNAGKHKQLRDKANKNAADDAKNIASGEAGAQKAKDGTGLVNLGYAYVTMDQFDKGIGFMEQGIAKGTKKPEEAKLHLGVAYAKAGRKDDAIKTFKSVKGDSATNDIAKYWVMVLNSQNKSAAAPATAAN